MRLRVIFALAAIGLFIGFYGGGPSDFALPPGQVAPGEPVQGDASQYAKWRVEDFVITPLATFDITARVILVDHYFWGDDAELAPVDLTVAWGPLSDTTVLKEISFAHQYRYYTWRTRKPPLPPQVINSHVANMHLLPGDTKVERTLKAVERDDIVTISGFLVRIDRADGWQWVSSLTRTDSGKGACEVVWVDDITVE